jgi:hypothetical protein
MTEDWCWLGEEGARYEEEESGEDIPEGRGVDIRS